MNGDLPLASHLNWLSTEATQSPFSVLRRTSTVLAKRIKLASPVRVAVSVYSG